MREACQQVPASWHRTAMGGAADFEVWLAGQSSLPGYGTCLVVVCLNMADSPLGLCSRHAGSYQREGRPGSAVLPASWWGRYERHGVPVPVGYADEAVFRRWCADAPAPPFRGQVNLLGLRPLVRAEIKWGMFVHAQRPRPSRWELGWFRSLVLTCRRADVDSLAGFEFGRGGSAAFTAAITREILHELRLVYFTPAEAKVAGFLETVPANAHCPPPTYRPARQPSRPHRIATTPDGTGAHHGIPRVRTTSGVAPSPSA